MTQSFAFTLPVKDVPDPVTVVVPSALSALVTVPVEYVLTDGAYGSPVFDNGSVALLTAFVLVNVVKPPLKPTPSL